MKMKKFEWRNYIKCILITCRTHYNERNPTLGIVNVCTFCNVPFEIRFVYVYKHYQV